MSENNKHAEPSAAPNKQQSVANPVTSSLNVVVSVPDSIEIKMVDASVLSDYEVWFSISSILASAVIGFLVAYVQAVEAKAQNANQLLCTIIVFGLLLIISFFTMLWKRRLLRKKGKNIKLKATNERVE